MQSRITKTGKVVVTMTAAEKELLFKALNKVIKDMTRSKAHLSDEDMSTLLPLCEISDIIDGIKYSKTYKSVLD